VRQVTGRNAPSVINAAYNFRQFWDGRAREIFNGKNPAGLGDPSAQVWSADGTGALSAVSIQVDNGSLASQAVGPPNNAVEMSFNGRTWPNLGRKLLNPTVVPLAQQDVRSDDSRLGLLATGIPSGLGLSTTYMQMVQAAFAPQWWNSTQCVDANMNLTSDTYPCPNSFTMMEANFSLYWGLAIQMYESTLIANDTPADRFEAGNRTALTAQQQRGRTVFVNNGKCVRCHKGAELTTASVGQVNVVVPPEVFNPTKGFENTAVRPVAEDHGIDAFTNNPPAVPPAINDGRFKVSHLRNIELRGPYFHNGEASTLRQVVDFYNRGGDFRLAGATNGQIKPLNLSVTQRTDLVTYLLALTDARVKNESAPFDHPSLTIHNGHDALTGADLDIVVPAVGAAGRTAQSLPLLTPFLNVNHQTP
jgi:cytochrome c peroxidase